MDKLGMKSGEMKLTILGYLIFGLLFALMAQYLVEV